MKRILLSILLLLSFSILKAQTSFIGQDKKSIASRFNKSDDFTENAGTTSDNKLTFSVWKMDALHDSFFYYDTNGICILFISRFSSNDELFDAIKDLNGKYDKVSAYSWINKETSIAITLNRNEKGFDVVYKKL